MLPPPMPSDRHSQSGLTILESLVLLIAAVLLTLVAVPVLAVKLGYKTDDSVPLVNQPPAERPAEIKTEPTPPLVPPPEPPKLPSPDSSLNQ